MLGRHYEFRGRDDRRCGVTIAGRSGANDGPLRCIFVKTHKEQETTTDSGDDRFRVRRSGGDS